MLREIYQAIKSKEIVMPDEHDGPVRDKYLWKCLLGRSKTVAGVYVLSEVPSESHEDTTPQGNDDEVIEEVTATDSCDRETLPLHTLNQQIFATLWGPTVAAMTFMFDRINVNHNSSLTQRILFNGFNSCALLCSSYGHLDNLIVILCKFTLNSPGNSTSSSSNLSSGVPSLSGPLPSHKTQLAAQTLFGIMREYANEMRESWSNIVEIILHWFMMGFLDDQLVVDDFALDQKIKMRRIPRKKIPNKVLNDPSASTGILSSFYSYFAGSSADIYADDLDSVKSMEFDGKIPDSKNIETINQHPDHIINTFCQPLSILEESKFLHIDSLMELLKAIINVNLELDESEVGDDIEAFKLEMLVQITLLNRDRVPMFWPQVSNFILRVLRSTAATPSQLLSERAISAIFRLAIRFTPRPDETSEQVLDLLRKVLYTLEPSVIQKQCTAIALASFINHCNAYIRRTDDWSLIFDYLLCIGIGCHPSDLPVRHTSSNSSPTPPLTASDNRQDVDNIVPDMSAVSIQIEDIPDEIPAVTSKSIAEKPVNHEANPEGDATAHQSPVKQKEVNENPPLDPSEPSQPFIPGNSSVRDIEAYKKCVETLTVVIKEILPKNASIHSNPRSDAEINQMAIDSLITLRFFSLHDDRLLEGSSKPKPSSPPSSPMKEHS
jgi:brefeldin A-resistance guanine nucleotide exchange factor 1